MVYKKMYDEEVLGTLSTATAAGLGIMSGSTAGWLLFIFMSVHGVICFLFGIGVALATSAMTLVQLLKYSEALLEKQQS